ncbi:hypothetical protein GCM10023238_00860 [Streptomyces heliomycini]
MLLFALCRQSQVLVERFLASSLPAGSISHLNYAQKVAQIPMTLSLMVCTVTFPVVARRSPTATPAGPAPGWNGTWCWRPVWCWPAWCAVIACAPQMIELLFQRGRSPRPTARRDGERHARVRPRSARQTLVGALVRCYFSAGRPSWYPLGVMAAGVVVTSLIGAVTVGRWGVAGIAAATPSASPSRPCLLLTGQRTARPGDTRRPHARRPRGPGPAEPARARLGPRRRRRDVRREPLRLPGGRSRGRCPAVAAVFVPLALSVPGRPALRIRIRTALRTHRHTKAHTWPLPMTPSPRQTLRAPPGPGPVPWVAMYHSVGDCSDDPYRITVTPGRLERQLAWLRRRGLRGVSVAELLARARPRRGPGPGRPHLRRRLHRLPHRALPLLQRFRCGATLFVLPGRLGGDSTPGTRSARASRC